LFVMCMPTNHIRLPVTSRVRNVPGRST
jgi:hypothetical protein